MRNLLKSAGRGLCGMVLAFAGAALAQAGEMATMAAADVLNVQANYYQQFDADYSQPVPGESYGGWRKGEIELSARHTAVVVMHAWECGSLEASPGIWRSVEYVPRSYEISRTVFPHRRPADRPALA